MSSLEPVFRRSSFSNGGGTNCVEAGLGAELSVVIRDSKDCAGAYDEYPTLATSREVWEGFTEAIKNGHFS